MDAAGATSTSHSEQQDYDNKINSSPPPPFPTDSREVGGAERSSGAYQLTVPRRPRTVRFVPDARGAPQEATTVVQGQPWARQPHRRHETDIEDVDVNEEEEDADEEEEEGEEDEDEDEDEEGRRRERHEQLPGASLEGRMDKGAGASVPAPRRARLPPKSYADYVVERDTDDDYQEGEEEEEEEVGEEEEAADNIIGSISTGEARTIENYVKGGVNSLKHQVHTSQFKGVHKDTRTGNWRAVCNRKRLGTHATEQAAAQTYGEYVGDGGAHVQRPTTSQFKGALWDKSTGTWRAKCKRTHLGSHATEEAAARAYTKYVEDGIVPEKHPPSSQFTGVSWNKKTGNWRARYNKTSLGHHATEEAAAQAYDIEVERIGSFDLNVMPPAGDTDDGSNTAAPPAAAAAAAAALRSLASPTCARVGARASQFKGVTWVNSRGKWKATCKHVYLGYYATDEAAARAYNIEAERIGRVDLNVIPPAGDTHSGNNTAVPAAAAAAALPSPTVPAHAHAGAGTRRTAPTTPAPQHKKKMRLGTWAEVAAAAAAGANLADSEDEEEMEEAEEEGDEQEEEVVEEEEEKKEETGQLEQHAQVPSSSFESRKEMGAAFELGAWWARQQQPGDAKDGGAEDNGTGGSDGNTYVDAVVRQDGGRSKFRGVEWNRADRKWRASVTHNRKNVYIASFDDEEDAAAASDLFWVRFELHGGVRNQHGGCSAKASLNFDWEEYKDERDELRRMTQEDLVQRLRQHAKGTRKRGLAAARRRLAHGGVGGVWRGSRGRGGSGGGSSSGGGGSGGNDACGGGGGDDEGCGGGSGGGGGDSAAAAVMAMAETEAAAVALLKARVKAVAAYAEAEGEEEEVSTVLARPRKMRRLSSFAGVAPDVDLTVAPLPSRATTPTPWSALLTRPASFQEIAPNPPAPLLPPHADEGKAAAAAVLAHGLDLAAEAAGVAGGSASADDVPRARAPATERLVGTHRVKARLMAAAEAAAAEAKAEGAVAAAAAAYVAARDDMSGRAAAVAAAEAAAMEDAAPEAAVAEVVEVVAEEAEEEAEEAAGQEEEEEEDAAAEADKEAVEIAVEEQAEEATAANARATAAAAAAAMKFKVAAEVAAEVTKAVAAAVASEKTRAQLAAAKVRCDHQASVTAAVAAAAGVDTRPLFGSS